MVFSANPLSLSLPDPAFESWLRDKGYLEILDERTTAVHSSSSASSSSSSSSSTLGPGPASLIITGSSSVFSRLSTLASLLTLNPFAKLTADDFAGDTPSWTVGFFGEADSYSWPTSPSQARMRAHENVKRYARNYACLSLLFLVCSLYQIPIALFGLIIGLALWEAFRLCSDRWRLEGYPIVRRALLHVLQFAIAVVFYSCSVQIALFCAIAVSYGVMILHASLRKLTPSKLLARADGSKRFQKNKYRT
ncbi:PRA1 family protein H isoform X2 [Magnolia sinica]|uniref:PRA1 family protein H isoform X2 n=1 Tax=Magnolia sinica TaxID=86752 RepID=UPI0026589257|nr:PRA1 family protein H isoform X2 [Magnolia sinica]